MANSPQKPSPKAIPIAVRYRCGSVDEFVERYAEDISDDGVFIRTPKPLPEGSLIAFELRLANDEVVLAGLGRVRWKRGRAAPNRPAGIGVAFIELSEAGRTVVARMHTQPNAGRAYFSEVAETSHDALLVRASPRNGEGEGGSSTTAVGERTAPRLRLRKATDSDPAIKRPSVSSPTPPSSSMSPSSTEKKAERDRPMFPPSTTLPAEVRDDEFTGPSRDQTVVMPAAAVLGAPKTANDGEETGPDATGGDRTVAFVGHPVVAPPFPSVQPSVGSLRAVPAATGYPSTPSVHAASASPGYPSSVHALPAASSGHIPAAPSSHRLLHGLEHPPGALLDPARSAEPAFFSGRSTAITLLLAVIAALLVVITVLLVGGGVMIFKSRPPPAERASSGAAPATSSVPTTPSTSNNAPIASPPATSAVPALPTPVEAPPPPPAVATASAAKASGPPPPPPPRRPGTPPAAQGAPRRPAAAPPPPALPAWARDPSPNDPDIVPKSPPR
jgi:uncharacterized protein (TIGR02266 family)